MIYVLYAMQSLKYHEKKKEVRSTEPRSVTQHSPFVWNECRKKRESESLTKHMNIFFFFFTCSHPVTDCMHGFRKNNAHRNTKRKNWKKKPEHVVHNMQTYIKSWVLNSVVNVIFDIFTSTKIIRGGCRISLHLFKDEYEKGKKKKRQLRWRWGWRRQLHPISVRCTFL